jgi:branched-chain amino acid transport system ATP-binding protein
MLLELARVEKRFGGLTAVSSFSAGLEAGSLTGLIGANGAGKTTLFSIVAGNQRPSSGRVSFEGRDITGLAPHRISRLGIARTFQIVRPFKGLTVLDNVRTAAMFGAGRSTAAEASRSAARVLELVGLADRAQQTAGELTLAGRKRLEVARALATQPKLMMLDEVLAGLTPTEVEEAIGIVRRVHRELGITILMVEHVLRAVMQLCSRVIVMHHGQKIAEGTPGEVTNDPVVVDAYLGVAHGPAAA